MAANQHFMSSCKKCGEVPASLFACARCRIAMYCGPACQTQDWHAHRAACRAGCKKFRRCFLQIAKDMIAMDAATCGWTQQETANVNKFAPDIAGRLFVQFSEQVTTCLCSGIVCRKMAQALPYISFALMDGAAVPCLRGNILLSAPCPSSHGAHAFDHTGVSLAELN